MFNKDAFLDLLAAAYNFTPWAEPATQEGQDMTDAGIEAAIVLGILAAKSPAHAQGVLVAAKLFVEVQAATDPNAYMANEAHRAWEGERFQDERASITITRTWLPDREPNGD